MNKTFKKCLRSYLKNSTLDGLKNISDSHFKNEEKFLWFVIMTTMIVVTSIVLSHLKDQMVQNPTITTLERRDYPVSNIYFPGLSICNINKISKKKAEAFAETLYMKTNLSRTEAMKAIRLFGNFYEFRDKTLDSSLLQFYKIYSKELGYTDLYHEDQIPLYLTRDLTTSCEEFLDQCFWNDIEYICSELFQLRATYEGFCCTFNYVKPKRSSNTTVFNKPFRVLESGISKGIRVLVKNNPQDYLYPIVPTFGVKVHLFNPYDYPDATSGGFLEEIAPMGTETFFAVEAHTILSTNEVKRYPVNIRKCIFDDEKVTLLGNYSYSNCLMTCKIRSMLDLCNCVPFMITLENNIPMCTLEDLPCIHKYSGKWNTIFPPTEDLSELAHEKQDSLKCDECFPSCSETSYRVFTNFSPLTFSSGNMDMEKTSLIRIYFKTNYSYLYKQDILNYWFEIVGAFGGMLGILLGGSIITIVEFIYFFTLRFACFYYDYKEDRRDSG